jgi:hypothetical protein
MAPTQNHRGSGKADPVFFPVDRILRRIEFDLDDGGYT